MTIRDRFYFGVGLASIITLLTQTAFIGIQSMFILGVVVALWRKFKYGEAFNDDIIAAYTAGSFIPAAIFLLGNWLETTL